MNRVSHLACVPLTAPQLAALASAGLAGLLGVTTFASGGVPLADDVPHLAIAAPRLGAVPPGAAEGWTSALPCRSGSGDGLRYRSDGEVIYGVLTVAETDFAGGGGASPLQRATEEAYRSIFRLLTDQGFPHLWRLWNYLADINGDGGGLERYRQFNIGREDAFLATGHAVADQAPAACALGVGAGPLAIAFLAGRSPALLLENPRQVSAYRYPADYGPRRPSFSRAALARLAGQELLFISGTASIVGHRTVHAGDASGQTRESLANIAAVLEQANRHTRGRPYTLADLGYRIYVRHAADFPRVQEIFTAIVGAAAATYVQADICRTDLLVEIEAQAWQATGED